MFSVGAEDNENHLKLLLYLLDNSWSIVSFLNDAIKYSQLQSCSYNYFIIIAIIHFKFNGNNWRNYVKTRKLNLFLKLLGLFS